MQISKPESITITLNGRSSMGKTTMLAIIHKALRDAGFDVLLGNTPGTLDERHELMQACTLVEDPTYVTSRVPHLVERYGTQAVLVENNMFVIPPPGFEMDAKTIDDLIKDNGWEAPVVK
jgi:hypothetical protein